MAENAENNSDQKESILLKDAYAIAFKLRWILITAALLFPLLYYYFDSNSYPQSEASTTIYISSGRQNEFYEMLLTHDAFHKAITNDPDFLVEVRELESGAFADQFSIHVHSHDQEETLPQFIFKPISPEKIIATVNGIEIQAAFGVPFSVNGSLITVTPKGKTNKTGREYEVKVWSKEAFSAAYFGSLEIEQLEHTPYRVKMLFRDDNPVRGKKILEEYIKILNADFSGASRDSIKARINELENQIRAMVEFFDEEKIIVSQIIDGGKVNKNIKSLAELQKEQVLMEVLIEKLSMNPQAIIDSENLFTIAEKELINLADGQEFLNKLSQINKLKNTLAQNPQGLPQHFAQEWTDARNYITEKSPELVSDIRQSLGSFGKEAEARIQKMLFATEPTTVVNYGQSNSGNHVEWKQTTIALLDLSAMIQEKVKLQTELQKIQPDFKVMQQPYVYEISNTKQVLNRLAIGVIGFYGLVLTLLFLVAFLKSQVGMAKEAAETKPSRNG
jgi:hypothetical protein